MALGKTPARVTIMGLGLFGGGEGAARFWANLGAKITITDLRSKEELLPTIEKLKDIDYRSTFGSHREDDFENADIVVVNPAIKPDNKFVKIARKNNAKIITEIGSVFQILQGHTFGITGSNGKSTTTAILGNMLKKHQPDTLIGGNIGGSLLNDINNYSPNTPAVLELSSFQLYYLAENKLSPNTAIVTNLSPNHLDWHGTLDEYYSAKKNIMNFQWPEDTVILNNDDPILKEWANDAKQRVGLFGIKDSNSVNAAFINNKKVIIRVAGKEKESFNLSEFKLPGEHNIANLLAASLAASMYSEYDGLIKEGIRTFNGLPHRLELVAENNGIKYYNDSISTTPESTIAAIKSFDCPKVIIAGGYDKKISLAEMAKEIAISAISAILLGDTAQTIKNDILKTKPKAMVKIVADMREAVIEATNTCPENGVVILSPGCASYGLFKNFSERGEIFKKEVLSK